MGKDSNLEILSAALSAHISELRLFWRETGLSCRWLVPDSEHCYVNSEILTYLSDFRANAKTTIENADVCEQWLKHASIVLDAQEGDEAPFSLRTLTWLLRVVESPHRDDLTIDSWNLYLWSVRFNDLPHRVAQKLATHLDPAGRHAIVDFDTLVGRFVLALQDSIPADLDSIEQAETARLIERFDRLRRFKNLVFYGVSNVGKAGLTKKLIGHWRNMTGRDVGMHCMTVFHPNVSYSDIVERRVQGQGMASSQALNEYLRPRLITRGAQDSKFFFEAFSSDNYEEGLFMGLCRAAVQNPDKDYVFVIERINSVRLSEVFGELVHLIDCSARVPWRSGGSAGEGAWDLEAKGALSVSLSQSGRIFFIPSNVFILGTATVYGMQDMHFDDDLMRSFALEQIEPMSREALRARLLARRDREDFARLEEYVEHSVNLWDDINQTLRIVGGDRNIIGYGPLISMCDEILASSDVYEANRIALGTWRYRLLPQILSKMELLLTLAQHGHRQALGTIIEILNKSWLRLSVKLAGSEDPPFIDIHMD